MLIYPSDSEDSDEQSSQEAADASSSRAGQQSTSAAGEPAADEGSTAAEEVPSSSSGPASSQGHKNGSQTTKRTKTIRHTAFKRVPVYTTVRHAAASSHVEQVDGTDVTVWTLCPACGKRHAKSYTQRVLDHYENVYCSACGKKHAKSYTETVSY